MYEDSLCADCGQDRARSMNPDMDGWYEVRAIDCHSCAAIDGHRAKHHKRSSKEYVIDAGPPDLRAWVPDLSATT